MRVEKLARRTARGGPVRLWCSPRGWVGGRISAGGFEILEVGWDVAARKEPDRNAVVVPEHGVDSSPSCVETCTIRGAIRVEECAASVGVDCRVAVLGQDRGLEFERASIECASARGVQGHLIGFLLLTDGD